MDEKNIDGLLVGGIFSNLKCNFPTFEKVDFILPYLEKMRYKIALYLLKGQEELNLRKLLKMKFYK